MNITWAPYIYEDATFILPTATVEFRQSFDWSELQAACPSSMVISSHVTIWGTLIGSNAHLLIGSGKQEAVLLYNSFDLGEGILDLRRKAGTRMCS